MPIDTFNRMDFEAALPKPWQYAGIVRGEHCYLIRLDDKTAIWIRSSIGQYGVSAGVGADSIRLNLLERTNDEQDPWVPLAVKVDTYTTRVAGWQRRLNEKIEVLRHWRSAAGDHCGVPRHIYRSGQPKSQGRIFAKCTVCGQGFIWIS
jgi:hypothetical protein